MTDNQARFQELLRELFQFDCADLDFGIYRIMNHKRDVINPQVRLLHLRDYARKAVAMDLPPLIAMLEKIVGEEA